MLIFLIGIFIYIGKCLENSKNAILNRKYMPIIHCKQHGNKSGEHTCEHIRAALFNNRAIHCNAVIGDMLMGRLWLCDSCKTEWEAANSKEQAIETFLRKMQVVCGDCFDKWREIYDRP